MPWVEVMTRLHPRLISLVDAGDVNRASSSLPQGVLFLDEIGEMLPALQGSLLRVLQSNETRPRRRDQSGQHRFVHHLRKQPTAS